MISLAKEKVKEKEEMVGFFQRFKDFCHGVGVESKRVHWTSKGDLFKYSVATLVFVVVFSLFFYLVDVVFAFLHSMIG